MYRCEQQLTLDVNFSLRKFTELPKNNFCTKNSNPCSLIERQNHVTLNICSLFAKYARATIVLIRTH